MLREGRKSRADLDLLLVVMALTLLGKTSSIISISTLIKQRAQTHRSCRIWLFASMVVFPTAVSLRKPYQLEHDVRIKNTSEYLWGPAHWQVGFMDSEGLESRRENLRSSPCVSMGPVDRHTSRANGPPLPLGSSLPHTHPCSSGRTLSEATKHCETRADTACLPCLTFLISSTDRCNARSSFILLSQ